MARHLIVGGTGFLGRHVSVALSERGDDVQIVGRTADPRLLERLPRRVTYEAADLRSADWHSLLQGVSVVHHYAWSSTPQMAELDPLADLSTNLHGTLRLLEAMRRRGGGRIVFASSGGTVYGRLKQIPVPETHALEPISAYGVAKLAAEKYLSVYRSFHGVDARIARLSNPFGIGQEIARNQGAATVFLHRALRGQTIQIYGDGEIVRDYIHVSDAVDGLIALADVHLADDSPLAFNIGSGVGTSLKDIISTLSLCLGRAIPVEWLPPRRFDVPVSVLDISQARRALKWMPRLTFEDGIRQALIDYDRGDRAFSTLSAEITA